MADKAATTPAPEVQEVQQLSALEQLRLTTELGKIQRKLSKGNAEGATNSIIRFANKNADILKRAPALAAKVEMLSDKILKYEPAAEAPAEGEGKE